MHVSERECGRSSGEDTIGTSLWATICAARMKDISRNGGISGNFGCSYGRTVIEVHFVIYDTAAWGCGVFLDKTTTFILIDSNRSITALSIRNSSGSGRG
mgnify:CR=1 FL=1